MPKGLRPAMTLPIHIRASFHPQRRYRFHRGSLHAPGRSAVRECCPANGTFVTAPASACRYAGCLCRRLWQSAQSLTRLAFDIEGLLGPSIGESEEVAIRAAGRPAPPQWLKTWESAHDRVWIKFSGKDLMLKSLVRKARREQPRITPNAISYELIAASHTRLRLASGWECRGRRLSKE
jgi:hypothetical protein